YSQNKTVDYTGSNKAVQSTTRVGQNFFRRSVLSAYNSKCCISGMAIPSLLVASHIVPWRVDEKNRLNPRNGLCLSVLHDKAFDIGVITITNKMTVSVSRSRTSNEDPFFDSAILAYDGKPIFLPEKFHPNTEFLSYHRQHIFESQAFF
ncbi:MAG: HNH endonuclease, partial [Nitrospinae bacterium]|nr:HNH endonuclease [Nitrospinota bacterium]